MTLRDEIEALLKFMEVLRRSDLEAILARHPEPPSPDPERIAQMMAHRMVQAYEHSPLTGKLHGACAVCGDDWPCRYAGPPPPESHL